jgi:hypothetical protein
MRWTKGNYFEKWYTFHVSRIFFLYEK